MATIGLTQKVLENLFSVRVDFRNVKRDCLFAWGILKPVVPDKRSLIIHEVKWDDCITNVKMGKRVREENVLQLIGIRFCTTSFAVPPVLNVNHGALTEVIDHPWVPAQAVRLYK